MVEKIDAPLFNDIPPFKVNTFENLFVVPVNVLEPISVYRTYERTNALTRLLRYKVRLRTVSLRA